jgi:predicted dithiol-disulfide oxidoreductase (DUF899 family)
MSRARAGRQHGMTTAENLPRIVSAEEWRAARVALLDEEKALTRARDERNRKRRELPMVRVEKDYRFTGAEGEVGLPDLFDGRAQLLVYHFMFSPEMEQGCPSCSFLVDNIGHLSHLHARDTSLVLVSRAPFARLDAYRERMGWTVPWYSSADSDFNFDFHVSFYEDRGPDEYNFSPTEPFTGEGPGTSAFLRVEDDVFHTYSAFARGGDEQLGTYTWLDMTALGRQEDWEEPKGRSDGPFMSWVRRHDEY